MSECSRRRARRNDVTNDDAILFHYLWYEFCRGRCGAGRRFSDSVVLEAWIKLPSVSWIKTLITSGDIYWTAFAGVRTESRPSRFASTLSRILFGSLASFTKPLSTVGANFCRSMIVSGDATIVSKTAILTTFMREISGLVRQITPLRSSLNHDRLYHTHTHTSLSLIFTRPWYQAISGRTKAVSSRVGHFYESGTQSCGTFLSLRHYKNAMRQRTLCDKWFWISHNLYCNFFK